MQNIFTCYAQLHWHILDGHIRSGLGKTQITDDGRWGDDDFSTDSGA